MLVDGAFEQTFPLPQERVRPLRKGSREEGDRLRFLAFVKRGFGKGKEQIGIGWLLQR